MPVLFRPESDIFRTEPVVDIMVNPVNTVGVMGAGLAKEFKDRYPDMFTRYKELCAEDKIQVGVIHIWDVPNTQKTIINLPTKVHYGDASDVSYVRKGLMSLRRYLEKPGNEHRTVAMPMLGCGLGRLDQEQVKPLFKECLGDLPNVVLVTQRPEMFDTHPKVLVIFGSRLFAAKHIGDKLNNFYDKQRAYMETSVQQSLSTWGLQWSDFDAVMSGGAGGADQEACGTSMRDPSYEDSIAFKYCKELPTEIVIAKADWERFGKRAGFLRNAFMADIGTHFIGFRPTNGTSPGTDGMKALLEKVNTKLQESEGPDYLKSRFFKNIRMWNDDVTTPMSDQFYL